MTKGEKRVHIGYVDKPYILEIKQKSAELIDLINGAASNPEWDDETFYEWKRLQELALTAIEQGCMWAVKAETI